MTSHGVIEQKSRFRFFENTKTWDKASNSRNCTPQSWYCTNLKSQARKRFFRKIQIRLGLKLASNNLGFALILCRLVFFQLS